MPLVEVTKPTKSSHERGFVGFFVLFMGREKCDSVHRGMSVAVSVVDDCLCGQMILFVGLQVSLN